MMIYKC